MDSSLVYNPTSEEIKVQAYGNWFTFKPGQYKEMRNEIAEFLTVQKAYTGLVGLPIFITQDMPADEASEEEKQSYKTRKAEAIAEAKKVGIERRIKHLNGVVKNLELSLRRDLEQKNIKVDPHLMATDGEMAAYRELAKYKAASQDEATKRVEELKKLKEQVESGE